MPFKEKLPFINLSLTGLMAACLALPTSLAQEKGSKPSESRPSVKIDPKLVLDTEPLPKGEYELSCDALREHLKKMRLVQVEYHMSETRVNDKKYRREWADLCDAGRPIFARARAAILQKFIESPKENVEQGKFLYELIDRNVSDDRDEGMYEMALALQANGVSGPKLPQILALSAVAENRFAAAKELIDKHAPEWIEKFAKDEKSPVHFLMAIYGSLESLTKDWEEELRLREEDAAGEPLPQVSIRMTKGEIIVELFENQAPETVGNFIHLVEKGFFDGLSFHRVLEHFVAQTGCPEGDGSGGPGYMIYNEAQKPNARKFFRGTLGVALSQGNPNSGGSQFFICFMPAYNLNGQYTAFGRVVSGIDVIGSIAKIDPDKKDKDKAAGAIPDEIIEAKVVRKRNHKYEPNKVHQ